MAAVVPAVAAAVSAYDAAGDAEGLEERHLHYGMLQVAEKATMKASLCHDMFDTSALIGGRKRRGSHAWQQSSFNIRKIQCAAYQKQFTGRAEGIILDETSNLCCSGSRVP